MKGILLGKRNEAMERFASALIGVAVLFVVMMVVTVAEQVPAIVASVIVFMVTCGTYTIFFWGEGLLFRRWLRR